MIFLATIATLFCLVWMGYDLRLFSTAYIGDKYDTLLNSWTICQAIDNLMHRPFNLGYSPIYYGDKNTFAYTIAPYGISVASLPIYFLSHKNLELTYNIYFFLTFIFTAWSSYLLIQYLLSPNRIISILIGLMVAFSQFRFTQLIHIETLSTQFYLFALYFFHRLLDTPRFSWAVGLAVMIWFTFLSSAYLGIMFLLTAVIIIGYLILNAHKLTIHLISYLLISCLLTALAITPFVQFRLQNEIFRGGFHYNEILFYSASPLDWFSGASQIYYGMLPAVTGVPLFLGFIPIVLSVVAWRFRKDYSSKHDSSPRIFSMQAIVTIYGLVTIAGYVFTLGPQLKIPNIMIPLPYSIVMQFPGFSNLRAMHRFIWLAVIGTSILSAYSLIWLRNRLGRAAYLVIFISVSVCLGIELFPYNGETTHRIPFRLFPLSNIQGPLHPFPRSKKVPVYEWLARQPFPTPIFQYPVGVNADFEYMADLYLHNQPMLNGRSSFSIPWWHQIQWNQFPTEDAINLLKVRGIRYILIHHELFTPQAESDFQKHLREFEVKFGKWSRVGIFDKVEVFNVP